MSAKDKALAKKAIMNEERAAKESAEKERKADAEWQVGARDSSRQRAQEEKELERMRKKKELEALVAADEESAAAAKKAGSSKKKVYTQLYLH